MEHELQAFDKTLVEVFGEELDVIAAVVKSIADAILHKLFGEIHIVRYVIERHLRFDHPELRQVAGGV